MPPQVIHEHRGRVNGYAVTAILLVSLCLIALGLALLMGYIETDDENSIPDGLGGGGFLLGGLFLVYTAYEYTRRPVRYCVAMEHDGLRLTGRRKSCFLPYAHLDWVLLLPNKVKGGDWSEIWCFESSGGISTLSMSASAPKDITLLSEQLLSLIGDKAVLVKSMPEYTRIRDRHELIHGVQKVRHVM